jgi:1-acyl-sn-glycerol-3-phosphate acyltransferase
MQMMLYIFLTRHREQDIPRISECLKYLAKSAIAPAVFIFPEGTDLSPSNVLKSAQCK